MLSQRGPLDLQLAIPFAERIGLTLQVGALRLELRLPLGHLRFAALHIGNSIANASLLGRKLLDAPIKLRLPLI